MTLLQTPSFTLHGKRALVTGGSRGIGFAAAVALAQAGAEVWIAARNREALDQAAGLAAGHRLTLQTVTLDITDAREVDRVLATLPEIDILVNTVSHFTRWNWILPTLRRWRVCWRRCPRPTFW